MLLFSMPCLPTFFCSFSSIEVNLFSRAAMMEFEINMSEMPLGKLSKENIQKGALISFLVELFVFTFSNLLLYEDGYTSTTCRI